MRRQLTLGALALLAAACTDSSDPTAVAANDIVPGRSAAPIDQSANAHDIAVIGDVPYGADADAAFPSLVDAINADPKVRLVVHVGDIKSGSTVCADEWYAHTYDAFTRFADPLTRSGCSRA